jgi:hypothetical protein
LQIQEADIEVIDLQHALDCLDNPPEHEGSTPSPSHTFLDLQDNEAPPSNNLASLSNFPVHARGESPLESYNNAHKHHFVCIIFLLVAILHTKHHITF